MEQLQTIKTFLGIIKVEEDLELHAFSEQEEKKMNIIPLTPGYYYCFAKKTAAMEKQITAWVTEVELKHEHYLSLGFQKEKVKDLMIERNTFVCYAGKETIRKDEKQYFNAKHNYVKEVHKWTLKAGKAKCLSDCYVAVKNKSDMMKAKCYLAKNIFQQTCGIKILLLPQG